ncbi:hypothetical protein SAMN05216559_0709 [Halomicrobium zhouii]|uniref:Uncharacterized protein n=1 Tax=Halomicrobium zhouii TaxID=767519 RepID=A0A1I6KFA0_9EURY|nr:hypothetical protein [Halomicrobium zhouii]SFR89909.1 hypothetical protein SAMN05216559_0709 [Halomicrobium zhouii]
MFPTVPVATADLVLAAVALPMVLAALVGLFYSVQFAIALGAGSVPASGTIGYALFYDPPSDG